MTGLKEQAVHKTSTYPNFRHKDEFSLVLLAFSFLFWHYNLNVSTRY